MRGSKRIQSGFTIVELVVTLLIISFLATLIGFGVFDRIQEARITSSLSQARSVLRVCEIARRKVLTTSVVGGITQHTYPVLAAWSSTDVLKAKLSTTHELPTKNNLGTDVLVKFDAARCYVAVDLPFLQDGYGGFETETVAGKTRVVVTTPWRASSRSNWVNQQKRFLHLEESR